jgi:hypothetical protein
MSISYDIKVPTDCPWATPLRSNLFKFIKEQSSLYIRVGPYTFVNPHTKLDCLSFRIRVT